jgi:hypothetical protein
MNSWVTKRENLETQNYSNVGENQKGGESRSFARDCQSSQNNIQFSKESLISISGGVMV